MASLGHLIAGVAHELNTPLGVCITAHSHLISVVEDIENKTQSGVMTRSYFDDCIASIMDATSLLESNLSRSRHLISSFKKLAINPNDQTISKFNLANLISEIQLNFSLILANQGVLIKFMYAEDIEVETYAEPLKLVLEQLIRNSLEYGFSHGSGIIYICIIEGEDCLDIDYRDDGKGIDENIRNRIFEPFTTTGRINGKVGLGMHLVYNLVTQVLNGSITLLDSKMGAHFNIVISKNAKEMKNLNDILGAYTGAKPD